MSKPIPLHTKIPPEMDMERQFFGLLFLKEPLDYLCYRMLYTANSGERGLATILRDGAGHMEVWRVLPGRMEKSTELRGWLEVSVFLDMLAPAQDTWMRDPDEEERRRDMDRRIAREAELRGHRRR